MISLGDQLWQPEKAGETYVALSRGKKLHLHVGSVDLQSGLLRVSFLKCVYLRWENRAWNKYENIRWGSVKKKPKSCSKPQLGVLDSVITVPTSQGTGNHSRSGRIYTHLLRPFLKGGQWVQGVTCIEEPGFYF